MHFKEGKRLGDTRGPLRLPKEFLEEPAMAVFVKIASEREYLINAVLGGKAEVLFHDRYTSSCEDKAEVAGIKQDNVLKVVFFEHDSKLYCVALPDEGEVDKKALFPKMLGISKSAAKSISLAKRLPEGMSYGTCTPFFTRDNIEDVELVMLADADRKRMVDVSLGGQNSESRKVSLKMRYGDVFDILSGEFGDKVRVCEIPLKR